MYRKLKIKRNIKANVCVIGGGTAGVFAAISAARTGADVTLIEKNSMLGGTITSADVHYPGLFYAWGKRIIDGPCWESVERVSKFGGTFIPEFKRYPVAHWHEQLELNVPAYTYVLYEMCVESGVKIISNAMISEVLENDDGLTLIVTDKSGLFSVDVGYAVDATGDATIAELMGYEFYEAENRQPATLQNRISGYNLDDVNMVQLKNIIESEDLPEMLDFEKIVSFLENRKIDNHVSADKVETSQGKTKLEYESLRELMRICEVFRKADGLENLYVSFIAAETGVRETNRIIGEKTVRVDDYINGVHYPDSICYAFYPVDLHVENGIDQIFLKDGIVPEIPYGALIPKGSDRLICAGRCVSSDRLANSAIRVEAPCMAMGQVAGCAAALCAHNSCNISELPYELLCDALRKIGAIVPGR